MVAEVTDRSTSFMEVKLGDKVFSSVSGQIKRTPQPYIKKATTQFNEARFVLADPKDEYRAQISKETDVEISVGFVNGETETIFTGKVWSWTRIPPDGTQIDAVDKSATMAETSSGVSLSSGLDTSAPPTAEAVEAPAGPIQPETQPEEEIQETVAADSLDAVVQSVTENILGALIDVVGAAISGHALSKPARELARAYGLEFDDRGSSDPSNLGTVHVQQSGLSAAVQDAARVGDVIVTRKDTLKRVPAGQGDESGIVLDYGGRPELFVRRPTVKKRSGLQLPMAAITTVKGWSPNNKQVVGASVVTPGHVPPHPTGTIQVPDWGGLNLGEPIVPGGLYTWNDATKNGSRVPTREIMERIAAIAVHIEQMTQRMGKGKWRINSWYRDPASNARAGGKSNSRHLAGDAVDVNFPGFNALYQELNASWPGGVAQKPGVFLHIDARHEVGGGRARWTY